MQQNIIPAITFWFAMAFSIGPFWIATMEAARTTSFRYLYRNYVFYLFVGWLPLNFLIGITVGTVGAIHESVSIAMYFIGAAVIFWMALRLVSRNRVAAEGFDFNWRTMTLVAWSNPKVWTTIPAGYLAADFTGVLYVDVLLFYFIGVPFFLAGVYLWGMIGRQGARVSARGIGYFNGGLLFAFGGYLLYQGIRHL